MCIGPRQTMLLRTLRIHTAPVSGFSMEGNSIPHALMMYDSVSCSSAVSLITFAVFQVVDDGGYRHQFRCCNALVDLCSSNGDTRRDPMFVPTVGS